MPKLKITRRSIAAIGPVEKATFYWDDTMAGFGLRVAPSGKRTYVIQYRAGAGGRGEAAKRMTIGDAAILTPEEARAEAKRLLGSVQTGSDPAADKTARRADITVAELVEQYLSEGCRLKKATTVATDAAALRNHIVKLVGKKRVNDITKADLTRAMHAIASGKTAEPTTTTTRGKRATGGRGVASRTMRVVSAMFSWAVTMGIRPDNPASGIKKYKDRAIERYLSGDELSRLGAAIAQAETDGIPWPETSRTSKHAPKRNTATTIDPWAAAAIRLLIFTGCRVGEIVGLRWEWVDIERGLIFLPDSKTGRKAIYLGAPAIDVLRDLERVGPFVIAGKSPDKPRTDLKRPWTLVCRAAGLEGLRLHDLRHSFASVGANTGLGLPQIGALLGHKQSATTARYAHLAAGPQHAAANAIAQTIAAAMRGGEKES